MRIFVITGAGISAESGIPTFRGKDGLWRKGRSGADFDAAKLATPEAFARDPQVVWEWYEERRQRIRAAQPNAAHKFIAHLARQADDFLLVTQNVDDLHFRAGLPNEQTVQIHGSIFETRCSRCASQMTSNNPSCAISRPPKCERCGALMRPGVVWFGEMLDPQKIEDVESFLARGPVDLTLVIGTTALFGYIVDWAIRARGAKGELIEINPEETPLSPYATKVFRERAVTAVNHLTRGDKLFAGRVLNQHPDKKSK